MNKKNIVFVILLVIFTLCGVFIGRQSKVIDVYENNETNIKKSKNMLSMTAKELPQKMLVRIGFVRGTKRIGAHVQ